MMKVSFDLQLDIQRAIRQEVAAGLAAATGATGKFARFILKHLSAQLLIKSLTSLLWTAKCVCHKSVSPSFSKPVNTYT